MSTDLEYLRQHYGALSDGALLAIDRGELVEAAQRCYDDELAGRKLNARRRPVRNDAEFEESTDAPGEAVGTPRSDEKPDWYEDAAAAFSRVDRPGRPPADDLVDAGDVLEAAGIPCYLELTEIDEEKEVHAAQTNLWRLLVPGNLNLWATSVLDRDIFNADFEREWKTHLEMLPDDDLLAMNPQKTFCGLFDRVERVVRAYNEELERRRTGSG